MAATKYTYSIQNDFPNHKVAIDRLTQEIQASSIVTALDYISTADDDCDIWFKDALSVGDETTLDGIVATHSGVPLPQEAIKVEAAHPFPTVKPNSPKVTLITPNWCDKTTWYPASIYVEDEVATDSGDHTTYELANENVIDTYHGKITFEDFLKDADGRSYRVVVKVNGTIKTEQDPHFDSGGDCTVNYVSGSITFLSALQPTDVVTATYHYADKSTFTVKPVAGKMLVVNQVEVQFSEDVEMRDSVFFQAYGYVQVFAPQLMQPPYNLPLNTLIPLGDPLVYKTVTDLINDSNHSYPAYPVIGASNWRGTKKPTLIFAWDYTVGATFLYPSYGMEIRILLEHDAVCGGGSATATLYCTSEDEDL